MPGKALVVLLLLHAAFVAFLAVVLTKGEASQIQKWGRGVTPETAPVTSPAP